MAAKPLLGIVQRSNYSRLVEVINERSRLVGTDRSANNENEIAAPQKVEERITGYPLFYNQRINYFVSWVDLEFNY